MKYLIALFSSFFTFNVFAQNPLAGPRLAGLPKEYIIKQLKDIRDGRRTKNTAMMRARIRHLTDQDIEDLAEYLSSLPVKKEE